MTAKADRVHRLLEDEDLKDAFKLVREHYRDLIESTPMSADNPEPLMDIRKCLHLLNDVQQALYTAIQDGHIDDYYAEMENTDARH